MGKRKNENVKKLGIWVSWLLVTLAVMGACILIASLASEASSKNAQEQSCEQLTACDYYLCRASSYPDSSPDYQTKWLVKYQICLHEHEVKENVK